LYLVYAISLFQGLRHGEDTQVGRVRQLLVQVIEMDIVVTYEIEEYRGLRQRIERLQQDRGSSGRCIERGETPWFLTQVGRVRQLLVQVIEMDIVVTYETMHSLSDHTKTLLHDLLQDT